jgi:hypothetical protein
LRSVTIRADIDAQEKQPFQHYSYGDVYEKGKDCGMFIPVN